MVAAAVRGVVAVVGGESVDTMWKRKQQEGTTSARTTPTLFCAVHTAPHRCDRQYRAAVAGVGPEGWCVAHWALPCVITSTVCRPLVPQAPIALHTHPAGDPSAEHEALVCPGYINARLVGLKTTTLMGPKKHVNEKAEAAKERKAAAKVCRPLGAPAARAHAVMRAPSCVACWVAPLAPSLALGTATTSTRPHARSIGVPVHTAPPHTHTHTHPHTPTPTRTQSEAKSKAAAAQEDAYWAAAGEGAKSKAAAKREAEEAKRQEQLAKKAELKRLQEQEEAALARPKVNAAKAGRVSGPKVGRGRSRARPVSQQQSGCPVC
jgi:hypothetical protein